MGTKQTIAEIADDLFYKQGYEHTSFADIAEKVGISRGNFYYHFKSKDEILAAVIEQRLKKTNEMLNDWESAEQTAFERVRCFIRILIMNKAKIRLYGCPVGTLTTELAKLDHPSLADASKVFVLFRDWLAKQFVELGFKDEATDLALQLLARSQGAATVASAFNDENFLHQQAEELEQWLLNYA